MQAKRAAASSGSGPVSTASSSPSSASSPSSSSSGLLRRAGDQLHLGRVLRLGDDVGRVRIDEADDHVDQARLAGLHRLIGPQQEIVGRRVHGERAAHRIEAFLDALGDADLALAGEQLHRAHLAHVHAHRVGGAAELGVERRERRGGFLDRLLVGGRRGLVGQQRLGIRCLLVHRDAHVVDGVDDVFDLLRIDDLGGQVVVHLRIGEIALLLAAGDQQLQLRLAVLGHRRHAPLDAERTLVRGRLAGRHAPIDRGAPWRAAPGGAHRRARPSWARPPTLPRSLSRRLATAAAAFSAATALAGLVAGFSAGRFLLEGLWLLLACHGVAGGVKRVMSTLCAAQGRATQGASKAKRAIILDGAQIANSILATAGIAACAV